MTEQWKQIKNFEGLYEISDMGNIKNLLTNELLTTHDVSCRDYQGIVLRKDGMYKAYRVHRLVAEAFVPNPYNKPFVNHKNLIKNDNCANNLEWVTYQENVNHYYTTRSEEERKRTHELMSNKKKEHWKSELFREKQRVAQKRAWKQKRSKIITLK